MLDDYFKGNPGVQDLLQPGHEPQSPHSHPNVTIMSYGDPFIFFAKLNLKRTLQPGWKLFVAIQGQRLPGGSWV